MQTALVVMWTHPFPGREQKALAYGAEVMEFWGKKAEQGMCSAPHLFFAESGIGLWYVSGERDALMQIHDSDEARLLTMKGELLLESFKAEFFYAGEDAVDYMTRYGAALAAIS
jgi:hypothetical protein